MRTVTYRFDDPRSFLATLREGDLELPLPFGARVGDGEWVLVAFEVEGTGETSTPARGLHLDEDEMVLAFEPRDWERLLAFAEGRPPLLATPPSGRVFEGGPVSSAPPSSLSQTSLSQASLSQASLAQASLSQTPVSPVSVSPASVSPASVSPATVSPTSMSPAAASVPVPFASKPSIGSFRAATRFAADEHAHARVLLVDDDDDIRDVVGAMLEAVGLTVDAVESAEAALDRLDHEPFDMAVLDWSLPGMTGLDLCKRIRAHEALAQLPILFLTAHSGSQDVVDAFASGADDYVVKPFRAPELGARIFSLLRRARFAGARVSS